MKKTLLLFALVAVIIFSCKKDYNYYTFPRVHRDNTPVSQVYSYLSTDIGDAGDTFKIAVHTVNAGDTAYLLGSAAGGQTWDYDSIPLSTTIDTTYLLNPATNPDYATFPTSNLLMSQSSGTYMFLNKSTQQINLIGISLNMYGITVKDTLGNPWTMFKFPMLLGANYVDSGSASVDTQIVIGFPIDAVINIKYKVNSTIDAGGTVKTPTGTYQCIRDKRIEYQDMDVIVSGFSIYSTKDTIYKYNYWSKSKKWNVIEIETDKNDVVMSIGYLLE